MISSHFAKLDDRQFICESDLLPLTSSPSDHKKCATMCQRQSNCTAFMFVPHNSSSHGDELGTCSWCPPHNITSVSYTPAVQLWLNLLGYMTTLPFRTFMPMQGALCIGRYVAVRGRIPDPAPDRFGVLIVTEIYVDYPINLVIRFNEGGYTNRLTVHTRVDKDWDMEVLPEGVFPFVAGQDFEVGVLATKEGFSLFVDGVYLTKATRTKFMLCNINYIWLDVSEYYNVVFN
ncbi:galectin-4-like [Plakobranchus ocellatus]|uniref:Galectin n=1 Tax=Plakobranchus ocellatus TaxID=259542 RepID=A0AAV3YXT4_9GAST|nr:galectin-4-like [Plakobranchus ocellatus]